MSKLRSILVLASMAVHCGGALAAEGLVVHEWGTFTSLQDESGLTQTHINTDDEPVPGFVHAPARGVLIAPTDMPQRLAQGAPAAHPPVTMRLETPVTYFHLPPGVKSMTLDVTVEFRGGWLTEFFPDGQLLADGKPLAFRNDPPLTEKTIGRLQWKNVVIGAAGGKLPETADPVWLAPRQVKSAASVTVGAESERFLFYRGVGHLDAPLRVRRDAQRNTLDIEGQFPPPAGAEQRPPALYIVDVRPDGRCAFRAI